MKSERRTLTDALTPQLTPEALALIKEGTPKPQTPAVLVTPLPPAAKAEEKPVAKPEPKSPVEPVKPRLPKEPEMLANASLTVRIPANLPATLLRAASERKLRKIKPYTQQDIVTEALTDWFKKNGY